MDAPNNNGCLPGISPSVSATEPRSRLASVSTFGSASSQASPSPNLTYWDSPMTFQSNSLFLESDPKFLESNLPSFSDHDPALDIHLGLQNQEPPRSTTWSPEYYNNLEDDILPASSQDPPTDITSYSKSFDSQPPSYQSIYQQPFPIPSTLSNSEAPVSNSALQEVNPLQDQKGPPQNSFQPGFYADVNGHQHSNSSYWTQADNAYLGLDREELKSAFLVPQPSLSREDTLASMLKKSPHTPTDQVTRPRVLSSMHLPQGRHMTKGSRFEIDREHKGGSHTDNIANSLNLPSHKSTKPWSRTLEMALKEFYPQSETFGEAMQLLINAYTTGSAPRQPFKHRSASLRLDVITSNRISPREMRSGDESATITSKGHDIIMSSDRRGPTHDGEVGKVGSEDECSGSEVNSESVDSSEADEDSDEMDVDNISNSRRQNIQPHSLNPVTPSTSMTEQNGERAEVGKRFACPFFQRNPANHQNRRSCAGPGWDSVHRAKEHVYRHHKLPVMCERCSQVFRSHPELQKHRTSLVPCEFQVNEIEGCSDIQEKELKSRKRPLGRTRTDIERWTEMFRILFPNDSRIPSPFYEYNGNCCNRSLEKFKEYIIAELPKKIQQDTDSYPSLLISRLKSSLNTRLKAIVCTRTQELFETYSDQGLSLSSPSQTSAGATAKSSRATSLGKTSPSIDHRSGLSSNAFPRSRRHPKGSSRRQTNSKSSSVAKPCDPSAKRMALEESEETWSSHLTYFREP